MLALIAVIVISCPIRLVYLNLYLFTSIRTELASLIVLSSCASLMITLTYGLVPYAANST